MIVSNTQFKWVIPYQILGDHLFRERIEQPHLQRSNFIIACTYIWCKIKKTIVSAHDLNNNYICIATYKNTCVCKECVCMFTRV